MRVDVQALGACSRLAERGAEQAAGALSDLTGADLEVEVTGASVASGEDLAEAFSGRESIGVSVGLRGGLDGEAVLAFDAATVDSLLSLLPGGASMERSAVTEVGNIALGGFLDGWANYLGKAIDMTPPRYFEADGAAVLPDGALAGEGVFLFESRLEATTTDLDFSIYMLPDSGPFRDLIVGKTAPAATPGAEAVADNGGGSTAVPYESLSTFASLAKQGSANAADNIAMMTGLETTVDVSRLRFVPLADIPTEVGVDPHGDGVGNARVGSCRDLG